MEQIVKKRIEITKVVADSPEFMVFSYEEDNDERDPLKIVLADDELSFRFIDTYYNIENGEEVEDHTEVVSNWFCSGELMTLDEVIGKYGHLPKYKNLIDELIENKIDTICHTKTDHWIELDEGEMTIDEYRKIRENSKTKSKNNKEGR